MGLLDSFASPSPGGALPGDYVPDAVAAGYGSLQPGGMFTNPNTMALLGAAGALLSRPQYSRMPGEYGSPLGSALLGAAQGAQGAYSNNLTSAQGQDAQSRAALDAMNVAGFRRLQQAYGAPGTTAGAVGATMNGAVIPSYDQFAPDNRTAQILNGFHNGLFSGLAQLFGGTSSSVPAAYADLLTANARAQEAQNQAALGGMNVAGFQRLQAANGAPGTRAGVVGAAMSDPGTSGASPNLLVDPNATPGSATSAFTGDPNQPGADLRPVGVASNGSVPLLGSPGTGAPMVQRASLLSQQPGQSSGARQPPPMFGVASIMDQYRLLSSFPAGQQMASNLLQLLPKVGPNSYLAVDGSVQALPNSQNVIAGQSQAEAYGKGAGEAAWAGPIASAQQWARVAPELAIETGKPYLLRGPGSTLVQNGRVVAQVPYDVKGVDPTGAGYQEFRYLSPFPQAGGAGNGPAPNNPGTGVSVNGYGVGGALTGGVVPSGGLLGSSSNASAGSTAGPRVQTSLSPLQTSSQEAQGKQLEEYGAGLQSNATAATNQQFIIDQMRRESGNGAGWTPGKFADWGGEVGSLLNGILPKDMAPSIDSALANYQSFQKNAMQLTTAATRQVSPRAAVQEMQMIREAMPGSKTSNGGLGYIFDQLSANNDFQIAKAQAADAWRPQHGGTLNGFESDWNKNVSPFAFLVHRMSESDLGTMAHNLQGTAQGRALLTRIMGEVKYAQGNGLFQDGAAQ